MLLWTRGRPQNVEGCKSTEKLAFLSGAEHGTRQNKGAYSKRSSEIRNGPTRDGSPYRCHDDPLFNTLRTDDDLIRAVRWGDHEAFAELCRRHTQTVRRRILAIIHHQEDAEDAMQEALFRAYTNLGQFRQSCKFSTWIIAIGINAVLSVIRKRKSRRESNSEVYSPDAPAWDAADEAPDPERHLAKAQIILLLRKELHGLPPKMQEVVTSYYGDDHSLQGSC
jgi:RNA polymerase sigma factor (sigma-70 family)